MLKPRFGSRLGSLSSQFYQTSQCFPLVPVPGVSCFPFFDTRLASGRESFPPAGYRCSKPRRTSTLRLESAAIGPARRSSSSRAAGSRLISLVSNEKRSTFRMMASMVSGSPCLSMSKNFTVHLSSSGSCRARGYSTPGTPGTITPPLGGLGANPGRESAFSRRSSELGGGVAAPSFPINWEDR